MTATPKYGAIAALKRISQALVVALLFSYFVSMGLGLFLIYALPQGLDVAWKRIAEVQFSALMIFNLGIPLGVSVGFFFLAIWLFYIGAFGFAWFDKPRFPLSLRNFVTNLDLVRSNYLVVLPQLASLVLVAVVLLQTFQESAGVQTGGISFESPVLGFVSVAYAPLVEEFSYRITTIGLLDGLNLLHKRKRLPPDQGRISAIYLLLLTMWKPERAKELLGLDTISNRGVRRGISRFEWLLLALTSLTFGAVHYLAGAGWQIGKISTAMLSGLVMGLVYLRYGAYAPVLLHWFFNYYFGVFDLASQLNLIGFDWVTLGIQLLNMTVGILLAVVFVFSIIRKAWSSRHTKT